MHLPNQSFKKCKKVKYSENVWDRVLLNCYLQCLETSVLIKALSGIKYLDANEENSWKKTILFLSRMCMKVKCSL